ncbi:MAG: hypothetical protein COV51_05120, partial [Gallionellaceae bacterium CG11_big_fil_rev_8_21_14_0_20_60_62]
MLNFTMEQFILVAVGVLVAYVAFRILAGLLRIAAFVAVIAGLWVLVFQPSMLNGQEINGQIAELSPKAQLAVAEFNRCFSQVVASIGHGGESECKQRAMVFLQQSGGQQYAAEAMRAIKAYLEGTGRVE